MKRLVGFLTAALMLLTLASCGEAGGSSSQADAALGSKAGSAASADAGASQDAPAGKSDVLVVYFSCTGNTKAVAERIAQLTDADTYELVPVEPYTDDDLNYNNDSCRANVEMNDPDARPKINGGKLDLSKYDTVIIGHPIWWGTKPRIIDTFLDENDLSGKVVLDFCTSGGSGVSQAVSEIKAAEPNADVRDGLRARSSSDSAIETWLETNGLL